MKRQTEPEVLTKEQLAVVLQLKPSTIGTMARDGRIKPILHQPLRFHLRSVLIQLGANKEAVR